jgi:mediator of RNA polymerase II transcription subunit 31
MRRTALAQQGILEQPEFVAYLRYLQYWHQPQFARFLVYPVALHMLDLLQEPAFRENLKHEGTAAEIAERLVRHWATWRVPAAKPASTSQPSTAGPAT